MIIKYLKNTELYKVMFRIAWPIALQSLITVGVHLMDTVMLSQMGDAQLSASALGGNYFLSPWSCVWDWAWEQVL